MAGSLCARCRSTPRVAGMRQQRDKVASVTRVFHHTEGQASRVKRSLPSRASMNVRVVPSENSTATRLSVVNTAWAAPNLRRVSVAEAWLPAGAARRLYLVRCASLRLAHCLERVQAVATGAAALETLRITEILEYHAPSAAAGLRVVDHLMEGIAIARRKLRVAVDRSINRAVLTTYRGKPRERASDAASAAPPHSAASGNTAC